MPDGTMTDEPPQNKRKALRILRRLPVRFGTETRMCGGVATDISEGGLRVECKESFPVRSLLTVFVQFPRHAVRLQARVAWVGGQSPTIGLTLTRASPALQKAYASWLAEVKDAAQQDRERPPDERTASRDGPDGEDAEDPEAADGGTPEASAAASETAPNKPARSPAESPGGVVKRRIETTRGQAYDVLIERAAGSWFLTIFQVPRQPGVTDPDHQEAFSDYASANGALNDFIRSH